MEVKKFKINDDDRIYNVAVKGAVNQLLLPDKTAIIVVARKLFDEVFGDKWEDSLLLTLLADGVAEQPLVNYNVLKKELIALKEKLDAASQEKEYVGGKIMGLDAVRVAENNLFQNTSQNNVDFDDVKQFVEVYKKKGKN